MRLFVGIELDDAVVSAASAIVDELKRRASTLAPRARIGWVTPERMHLTVRFIGHVDDLQVPTIRDALAPAIPVEPFELHVDGIGTFPPTGSPRVIWAGLTLGTPFVLDVERHVTARLQVVGIAPEERAYSPHLTLGRVREPAGLHAARLLDGLPSPVLGSTRVSACTLFESRLSPKGPTYVALQRTVLGGPAEAGRATISCT